MGKGSSSSSTSQATTSTTTDIGAQGSGIAIGPGASYVNELGDNATSVINKIVDFSGGVLHQAGQLISDQEANNIQLAGNTVSQASATAANALNASQLGQSSILTNPATLIAIVAALGLVTFLIVKKGKL